MLDQIPSVKIPKYIYKNEGGLRFTDKTRIGDLPNLHFQTGLYMLIWIMTGDLDIVMNNINGPSMIYENRSSGTKKNKFIDFKFIGSPKTLMDRCKSYSASKKFYPGFYKQSLPGIFSSFHPLCILV